MEALNLESFIYQVKKEIEQAQEKHMGENAMFSLKEVELTINLTVQVTDKGGVDIKVI